MIICLRSGGHLRYELNSLKRLLHRRLEIKRPSLKRDYKRIFGTAVRISSPAYARVALYPVFVGYIIDGRLSRYSLFYGIPDQNNTNKV